MLGYTEEDINVMIGSIDLAMFYVSEYIDKESMTMQGLIDAASFLEGLLAEGRV